MADSGTDWNAIQQWILSANKGDVEDAMRGGDPLRNSNYDQLYAAARSGDMATLQKLINEGTGMGGMPGDRLTRFVNAASRGESGVQKAEDAQNQRIQQLTDVANAMMRPPDPNDPMVKQIMAAGASNAAYGNQQAGIGGPAAQGSAQAAAQGAYTNLGFQRQQLGAQMLANAGQLGAGNVAQLYNIASNQTAAQNAGSRQTASMIGGGIGAVGGAVGAYYTGNPALIGQGYQLGSTLGAGVAPQQAPPGLGYGGGGGVGGGGGASGGL